MNTQLCRTVLIVEDCPEDREMYRRYLLRDRDYDYTIVEASFGKEGVNLWQQHQPDAVLLDYQLPDLDGLEFLAALQTQQPLPIVMMTGVGSETIAVQAIKAGAQDYLVKGQITPESLKLALDGAIKTVQLQTQLQQRIDRERVIAQIAQNVSRSLDLDEILHTTVIEVRQFLQTDRVVVFQVEAGGNGRVVAESVGAEWRSILSEQIYDPCFVESYVDLQRQGRVTVKADIYDGSIDPCHVQLLAGCQVRANLVVPILHDDQFWGVLIAHHCAAPRQWKPLEIDLLQQLSIQVSVAIRQAELYQQAQTELAERKRTEEVLRSSEERLLLGLQAARMGTWDWNILENQIIWSANMEALFGLAPGEFDGSYEQFVARLHPEDRDRVLAAIAAAMTPGANYDIEFRVLYPDGTVRWALSQGKVFYDASGQPIRMSGVDLDITDRKRAAEALQESEARFRQLAENIDAVFWLREEPEGRVSYVSSAYERLWGWQSQELYESPSFWVDHIHPDDRECTSQAFQSKAAAGEFNEEYRIVLSDGRIRWVHDRCFPLYDRSGKLYRFAGIAEDISDRKQTEDSLLRSEEFNRRILENNQDCIKVLDLEGRLLYMNDGGQQLLEIADFADYDRSLWTQFWGGSEQELAQAAFAAATAGTIGKFEGRCPTATGVPKWWEVSVIPLHDADGNVEQILVISHDLTERRQAEDELRQAQALVQSQLMEIEAIYQTAPIGLAVFDVDLRFRRLNQRLAEINGIAITDHIGRNLGEIVPDLADEVESLLRRVLETGEPVLNLDISGETNAQPGIYRTWLANYYPLKDSTGRSIGINVVVQEITDRKQIEQALAERNQELNRFSYIVSHDLKAPLRAISNLATWIRDDLPPTIAPDILTNLDLMRSRVDRMDSLITGLLEYARVGSTAASLATFRVEQLLAEIVDSLSLPDSFVVELPAELPPITTNRVLLCQVLANLIGNAYKHHDRLDGRIQVTAQPDAQMWEFSVTDDGRGIAPANQAEVFDIFRTLSGADKNNTGIGLSIVKKLVEIQGGEITLESQLGIGTTFKFTWLSEI